MRPIRILVVGLALLIATPVSLATHTVSNSCFGESVEIQGTDGNDSNVRGDGSANVIAIGAGSDNIYSHGSGDRVCADDDNDYTEGGNGADRLAGRGRGQPGRGGGR